ncbi:olfactory receptor 1E5-like [Polypterus senegalus]
MSNSTSVTAEFILHCVVDVEQRTFTISLLMLIYLVTLLGNLLVILVIVLNCHLQKPMYLYISTLAIIDLINTNTLIPKMLAVLLQSAVVPYGLCLFQMFLIYHVEVVESLLFALMALDRYVAIVYPLRYPSIVTNKTVWSSILVLNGIGALITTPYMMFVTELRFCRTNVLPYCFCDYATMVHTACNDDPKYLITLSSLVSVVGVCPFLLICFSYWKIAQAALKISSAEGKMKAFNTLLTHLIVVGVTFIPLLACYILPGLGINLSTDAYNAMVIVAIIVPPMLNPVIYSLRNKEIKNGIQRLLTQRRTSPGNDKK